MYFTFLLHYVSEDNVGNTKFEVIDDFHAKMTVETKPHSFTRLSNPLQIGIYQDRSLYLDVTVEPSINSEDRTHRVTVSFYTDKEIEKDAENGTN